MSNEIGHEDASRKIKYLPPRFFINVGEEGELGNTIVMFSKTAKTKDEANMFLDEDIYLFLNIDEEGNITIDFYQDGELLRKIPSVELINGQIFLAAKPLLPEIWNLPEKQQSELTSAVKTSLLTLLIHEESVLSSDQTLIGLTLDRCALKTQKKGRYFFSPISSPIYLKNIEYKFYASRDEE